MISDDLKRIYTSAPVNITAYEALYLTHPAWPEAIALITNTVEQRTFNFKGVAVDFQPATFSTRLPKRDDLGIVDFEVVIPLTAKVANYMILAELSLKPIDAALTVYIDGQADEQLTPIELQIDQISMTNEFANGRAQRIDLLNRAFPRRIVRAESFPGLWR
jgi:hypothetical protein